jgi:hypothetical protein
LKLCVPSGNPSSGEKIDVSFSLPSKVGLGKQVESESIIEKVGGGKKNESSRSPHHFFEI